MNYIGIYLYAKINVIRHNIPKYCIRFLYKLIIIRKNGISCEVLNCLFLPLYKCIIYFPFVIMRR